MLDPKTGYAHILYRHPVFHAHLWCGAAFFLLGPLQLQGTKLLGSTGHRRLGYALVMCYLGALSALFRTAKVPYAARDPSLPAFFILGSIISITYLGLAIRAVRAGDVETHRRLMLRAFWGSLVPIIGNRVVIASIYPYLFTHKTFTESLIATNGWALDGATQLTLTLMFAAEDNARRSASA